MDRKLLALISGIAVFAACNTFGQGPGEGGAPGVRRRAPMRDAGMPGRFAPADQQRFRRNAELWLQMSPAEQQFLRQRAMLRRERMKREAEGALTQSGLTLDEQRRALYHTRYVEERRKLELGLRQELQQRRQQELPPMIDRLRREFEPQQMRPSASGTSTPNVSPIKHR